MSKKRIFILTHQQGFETDSVIDELKNQDAEVLRFNTDSEERVSRISFEISQQTSKLLMRCDQITIDPSTLTKAWFQQPYPFDISSVNQIQLLQRANLKAAFDQIDGFISCEWLNRPSSTIKASNKILQLKIASSIGMQIPSTLISNDPNEIRRFCKGKTKVMKNLDTPWYLTDQSKLKASYTKGVSSELLDRNDALGFCPIIYQEAIDKVEECRVVSISKKTFAVSSKPSSQAIDIRKDQATGHNFRPIEFPIKEYKSLLDFKKILGIDYCGADYLIDKDRNWVFLEANTCGAWWWVDKYFNNQIRSTIVAELLK